MMLFNVWLDDEPEKRTCPPGFIHVGNVEDVKELLLDGYFNHLSLDHDLGVCEPCATAALATGKDPGASCTHVPTGYDLVVWMEKTGNWPESIPTVHSRNPVGRERMERVIKASYGTGPTFASYVCVACLCGVQLKKIFAEEHIGISGMDLMAVVSLSMGWVGSYETSKSGRVIHGDVCFACKSSSNRPRACEMCDSGQRILLQCECGASLTGGPSTSRHPNENYHDKASDFAVQQGWKLISQKRRLNATCFACIQRESGTCR